MDNYVQRSTDARSLTSVASIDFVDDIGMTVVAELLAKVEIYAID